ncbi:MAG TPA: ABC transporter ATP-binding protein [Solirubrobacteraceae bacterium]|jgi:peptide/nickel transport system ATP-binding protein
MSLLEIADLRVSYPTEAGEVRAVDGVSFAVASNEVVALVGESGSGKSTVGLTLMGLTRGYGARTSGSATLEGRDLLAASERELQSLRGRRMAMVFQDPMSSLNPVQRVGWQISEQIRAHEPLVSKTGALERAVELMERAGIPQASTRVRAYPHELSGGMRQRVMIAMALSCEPALLIADEPTTALDVTTQAQILAQLKEIGERTEMGMLLITHDLGVVADIADRILVMRSGRLMEQGEAQAILRRPQHSYTQSLLAAYAPRPARAPRRTGGPLLEAEELSVRFRAGDGWVRRGNGGRGDVHALDVVSLTLSEGETLGVVGESGAGKTTLIRCLMRLLDPTSGTIRFRGEDITHAGRRELAPVRRELQMVFQDSSASLNPRRRVEWILATGLRLREVPRAQWRGRAAELLERVGLQIEHLDRYPHELSGGERQRVGIARALSCEPRALVLDEPVSSLDATVRAQVLDLLASLQEEGAPTRPLSYLLVSHDLMVVRGVSDRVAVMRGGRIVEIAPTEELFGSPRHEYTRALLAACLKLPGQVRSAA